MNNIIKRKERLQVGFVVLVIISCSLLIMSAIIKINSIRATCKPLSEMSRNSTEVSELDVVEEPQQPIIEESISVAAEEASSEPAFLEEPNLESVERSEPVLAAAHEPEVIEQTESEENPDEPEPWIAEDTPYDSTTEATVMVLADPKPEPDMIEEPDPEVIEETEVEVAEGIETEESEVELEEIFEAFEQDVFEESQQQIIEESTSVAAEEASSEPELFGEPDLESVERSEPVLVEVCEPQAIEQAEFEECLDEPESWIAEDTRYESTAESMFEVVADPKPELDMIEETDPEVGTTEETDAELFAKVEAEKTPEAFEWESFEESQQQITEESTSVAADEASSEPEPLEELESVESSESVLVEACEPEAIEQTEFQESLDEFESWIDEDTRYESTVESTFEVVADPKPELEMIAEQDLDLIEMTEVGVIEGTKTEIIAEVEPEETLVAYELDVVEEPRQEIVEEQESESSYLLQEVLGEHRTSDIEKPMTESIESSEPELVEKSQLEVSVTEEEIEPVSLFLANIFGKARPVVTEEPQATTAKEVEADETLEAPEPEVVEKPHQKSVEKQKSVFSYLQEVLKKLKQ
ncbi:hypothetical protein ACFL5Z_07455 [Planctomycetota bacterium]